MKNPYVDVLPPNRYLFIYLSIPYKELKIKARTGTVD